jgi:transposase
MARTDQSSPEITGEQRVAVEAALRRRDLAPRVRERLEMVKAVALGQDLASSARWSGRSPRTVRRWVGRFAAGGIPALADAPRPGRPAVADAGYRRAAEAALEAGPRALGLPFDVWTSARLVAYLERETGGHITPGWLRALLGRWEWACGRPKHTLKHLQDPAAVAACEEELAAAAGKSRGRAGAVRIPSRG